MILLRKELLVKHFDKESEMSNPRKNLYIQKLKDACAHSKMQAGVLPVPESADNKNCVSFIRKNDLFFMAVVQTSEESGGGYQYETLWVMESLKTIIEVIEESIGIDKLKE